MVAIAAGVVVALAPAARAQDTPGAASSGSPAPEFPPGVGEPVGPGTAAQAVRRRPHPRAPVGLDQAGAQLDAA
ncbi:MAG: hypothetical protein KC543_07520, partial [Myxococcales bacterium]|nr:hypothetical protein [Myxococcales bacterium]